MNSFNIKEILEWKKFIVYFFITLIIPLGFLFSPKPQEKLCSSYVSINDYTGFIINCDSFGFLDAAEKPSMLFEKDYFWQSRPLFIFAGSAIGYGLSPLIASIPPDYFQTSIVRTFPPTEVPETAKIHTFRFLLGYIIINIFLLFCSVILLDRIVDLLTDSKFTQNLKYIFSIFIVSNLVTKTFFFSPHQQMMIMVCPLLCCYLALKIVLDEDLKITRIILFSFLTGFLNLFYGSSILILLTITFAFLYREKRRAKLNVNCLKELILIVLSFITPLLVWVAIITFKNGSYFNPEIIVYRQFVWIYDSLLLGFTIFLSKLETYTGRYILTMIEIVPVLVTVLALKIINLRMVDNEKSGIKDIYAKNIVLAAIFIFYLMFLWLINLTALRLTYNLFFILLCFVILDMTVLNSRFTYLNKRITLFASTAFIVLWSLYNIFSYGPFE